jgi:hypothetical protein
MATQKNGPTRINRVKMPVICLLNNYVALHPKQIRTAKRPVWQIGPRTISGRRQSQTFELYGTSHNICQTRHGACPASCGS